MNMRTNSAYGLKPGTQPKGRLRLKPPSHPKFIPFNTQAYMGRRDTACRSKPRHNPSEYGSDFGSIRSRPKSAVSRRSGRSGRSNFSRASTSKVSSRKVRELEHALADEKQHREDLEKEVEKLRMLSSHALSFYKSDHNPEA